MSVQQEHRYIKLVRDQNDSADRRKREAEALYMERGPRPAVVPPTPNASKQQVRSWMRRNASHFETATSLCEAANAALQLPPDAMDDETHWVWDEAVSAIDWATA